MHPSSPSPAGRRTCARPASNKEGPLLELSPAGVCAALDAARHLAAPDCRGPGLVAGGAGVLPALLTLLRVGGVAGGRVSRGFGSRTGGVSVWMDASVRARHTCAGPRPCASVPHRTVP